MAIGTRDLRVPKIFFVKKGDQASPLITFSPKNFVTSSTEPNCRIIDSTKAPPIQFCRKWQKRVTDQISRREISCLIQKIEVFFDLKNRKKFDDATSRVSDPEDFLKTRTSKPERKGPAYMCVV